MKTEYTNNRQRGMSMEEGGKPTTSSIVEDSSSINYEALEGMVMHALRKCDKLNLDDVCKLAEAIRKKMELYLPSIILSSNNTSTLSTPLPSTVEDSFSFTCTELDCPHCSHDENEFKSDTVDFEREAELNGWDEIKVTVKNGLSHIDGRMCSYDTEEIRSKIQEFAEVNYEFILPKKYTYVITELNGFAKIVEIHNVYIKGHQTTSQEGLRELVDWMENGTWVVDKDDLKDFILTKANEILNLIINDNRKLQTGYKGTLPANQRKRGYKISGQRTCICRVSL